MNGFVLTAFLVVSLAALSLGKRDANSRFKLCCARHKTGDQLCKRRFCDFNALTQDSILIFLNLCSPKGNTVRNMWSCATSNTDHTDCCKKKGVLNDCIKYCAFDGAPPPNDFLKHLFCLPSFDKIKSCFKQYLNNHSNIFGDF